MIRLVYVSYALHQFSQEDLLLLLKRSRKKNKNLDITGVLFYVDDSFIQVLEGPEKNVEELYEGIKRDLRHEHCRVIDKQQVSERLFQEWSMGFCLLEREKIASLEGFNDFLYKKTELVNCEKLGNGIKNLLNLYKGYCVHEL